MSGRHGERPVARRLVLVALAAVAAAAVFVLLWVQQSPFPFEGAPVAAPADRLALVVSEPPRPLPELRFVQEDGRVMTLEDFHGRAVLLNLWATWCVPCRVEMPALDRLQTALGSADFEVVALSIDRGGPPGVEAFYQEAGLRSLGVYVDQTGEASRALGAVGIPTTLLIDWEGREVARKIGPAEWDSPEMVNVIRQHLGLSPAR